MSGIPRQPGARLIAETETGTPEWFAVREGKMTGSRIAAAMGLSPWMSPFALYFVLTGMASEQAEDTPAMEWGRRLEPVVIQKFAENHPELHVRTEKTVWQSRDREYQVVSPDALIVNPGAGSRDHRPADAIFEAKTTGYPDDWGTPGTDQVPIWIRCQILWMLDTLGLRWCHVGALFNGRDYQEYLVEYDQADVDILRRGAVAFLDRVAQRDRPDIDGSDSTYEVIRKFHPDIDGSTVQLPDDLVQTLSVTQESYEEAREALGQVRSTIAEFMGTAKTARASAEMGGGKVADRRSRMGGTPYVQTCNLVARPTIEQKAS